MGSWASPSPSTAAALARSCPMRPPTDFGYDDNRLLDATGRPRMDSFQPPDSRRSMRDVNRSGLVAGFANRGQRPPKPTTRPPPIAEGPAPRPFDHSDGYQQRRYPTEDRPGYSAAWERRDNAVSERYEAEQRYSGTRQDAMPYRETSAGSSAGWSRQDADFYYRHHRPEDQRDVYGAREALAPPSTQYYYDPPPHSIPQGQYRQPPSEGFATLARGYPEQPVGDYPPTAYPPPPTTGSSSSGSHRPPLHPQQQQPYSDIGGYAVGNGSMGRDDRPRDQYRHQYESTIPIRQNLNSEQGAARPSPVGSSPVPREGYGLRAASDSREGYDYSRPAEGDRAATREKGVLSPPSTQARSPQELPPDFEPEADVPCQADLDSVRHRAGAAPVLPVPRRVVRELPEEKKPVDVQLGPSRLETIPERSQQPERATEVERDEEEEMPAFGLKAPVWPEGYHPPSKKIPSGTVTCVYTWPRMKLGRAVAQFLGFTRQLLPCDGEYSRLPCSGWMWKSRALEPVGIAIVPVQASDSDREQDTYVDYWGQRMVVKVAVLKAEKVDKEWVAALEKSRNCRTLADEKIQEMELAIPAHIELVQKGLFRGEDGSQVRGDTVNFPLFNDFLAHLERFGRGGRIKDPFRDSRPVEDRQDRYANNRPAVLTRSDNAAETALFEERARLWDALSKCSIDESNYERFSCILCKNGCQGLGQLVEHVTSRAHTSTAVLFQNRDAVMTLPIIGTKDRVVKFDVKDLRHWVESAPGTGDATPVPAQEGKETSTMTGATQ
ncbi:hypothetical protein FOZ61_003977 [Perkinsus olseni]|nr:hypothetical protein FOZ61_003977 [Perkinsus olseni]